MNGYDFDNTIFKGNSFRRFFFFCLIRLPYLALYLPLQAFAWLLCGLHILNKHAFLNILERFILFVPNKRKFVEKFWKKNIKRVKHWYLEQKRGDDVVVSASPQYLVEAACGMLGIKCIASNVNEKTGKTYGKHCHDKYKQDYYKNVFGDAPLETYYSDSMSDVPMFKLAKRGYFVKGNKITLIYENGEKTN